MSQRGFKGFRKPSVIADEDLKLSLDRMSLDGRYIYWTGKPYRARAASLRSNSLAALGVAKRPITLKDWITKAARVVDPDRKIGFDPARVREGLYLHRDSKPAVYFELKKDDKGNFISVNNVPNADGFPKGLKAGDIVIPAKAKTEGKTKGKKQATPALPAPSQEAAAQ